MTRGDRLLVVLIACLALFSWPLAAAAGKDSGSAAVITAPEGETVVSLSEDGEYAVEGAIGTVIVQVSDGRIRVVDSTCPDRTCMQTGAVFAPGSVIACVPNRVVIRVRGGGEDGYDARIR